MYPLSTAPRSQLMQPSNTKALKPLLSPIRASVTTRAWPSEPRSALRIKPKVNRLGSDKVYRLEINTRRDASGELIQELTTASVEALTREIAALKPEAIAICLLFAFKNNQEERALREALSHVATPSPYRVNCILNQESMSALSSPS